ncbi:MAG: dTDP-glucose 4,6-dehydratase [Syntrophotalea acetylenica]|nr:dTDP-glucose 4,6-dehydratase [Syntrophotalea acetylenica]
MQTYLVTGGAGFIGSNFVHGLRKQEVRIINLDLLTYAGNMGNLAGLKDDPDHVFVRGDIGCRELVCKLLAEHRPDAIVNFAAESHVDRSIVGPEAFVQTNVEATFKLLDESKKYWDTLEGEAKEDFRFLHVSTDEVFGTLDLEAPPFTETTPYAPNSPYSASKASSDHFVRSYFHTYGLPTLITNCSNNYGPRQFPEKLIPLMFINALAGKPLPVYGDGQNVRDWLYVTDHCAAIIAVLEKGVPGQTYNIGGKCEKTNVDIVKAVCRLLDEVAPPADGKSREELISFVKDRPGHDFRYAINCDKIESELGWAPLESFESGMSKTIRWYMENDQWIQDILSGEYANWVDQNYKER